MVEPSVASFVLRFSSIEETEFGHEKRWRIKVTHVQGEDEIFVSSLQEAMSYIESVLSGE